jgi:hypothetical protein
MQAISTRVERIDLRSLKLLELNARFMRHETFQRLVENLRRDGRLTQTPFAVRPDESVPVDPLGAGYVVLSGNHRVQAALQAGIESDFVLLCDDLLPEAQRVAIQLAHNAINGEDDPAILKALYEQIDTIDWKLYAGLDDKALGLLQEVKPVPINEANLSFTTLSIVFLPDELEHVREIFDMARAVAKAEEYWLVRGASYDPLLDALEMAAASYHVKNQATALDIILQLFMAHLEDLVPGYMTSEGSPVHTGSVPLAAVTGKLNLPAKSATIIRKAVERLKGTGETKTAMEGLVTLAQAYLDGRLTVPPKE